MCVMCIQYRIIILIIIIISLGQIILSYIANTSHRHARTNARTHARKHVRTYERTHERTHARTYAHTHTHTHTHVHTRAHAHPPTQRRHRPGCRCSMGRCAPIHDEVNTPLSPLPLAINGRSVLHSNKQSCVRRDIRDSFGCFSRIIKVLGRTKTLTCDSMCVRTIRTV